jgi:CheY-like chemotaxis protein
MVRHVLSFARGLKVQRSIVSPSFLLREITKIIQETFPKSITLQLNIPELTWNVAGDPTQLHQVLLNLALNARDAMPVGGELLLSVTHLDIEPSAAAALPDSKPGSYVVLTVSDTGTGMPPEVIEMIFEPFFTTKELGRGTGLGLSTTLSIVKNHAGFVTVESEPGKGSTFRVHLPAETDHSPTALDNACGAMPRGNGETILVIDDEASVRAITRQTLETYGYSVLLAADGAEGVATFDRHKDKIDVVLTDMMMPVMDGAAAIGEILRLRPEARIIAGSGLPTKETEAKAASLGEVRVFIPKPYGAGTLLRSLREALEDGKSK